MGWFKPRCSRDGRADFRNRGSERRIPPEEKHRRSMFFRVVDGEWQDWRNFGWGTSSERPRTVESTGDEQHQHVPVRWRGAGVGRARGSARRARPSRSRRRDRAMVKPALARDPSSPRAARTATARGFIDPEVDPDAVIAAHRSGSRHRRAVRVSRQRRRALRDDPRRLTRGAMSPQSRLGRPYHCNAHDIWISPDYIIMPFQHSPSTPQANRAGSSGCSAGKPSWPITIALIPRNGFPDVADGWVECDIEPEYVDAHALVQCRKRKLMLDGRSRATAVPVRVRLQGGRRRRVVLLARQEHARALDRRPRHREGDHRAPQRPPGGAAEGR